MPLSKVFCQLSSVLLIMLFRDTLSTKEERTGINKFKSLLSIIVYSQLSTEV